MRRVALLLHPDNPAHAMATRDISTASHLLGIRLQVLKARDPKEIRAAFGVMTRERPGAVLVMTDAVFTQHRAELRDLAAKSRLPVMYGQRLYPEAGGLMSYGVDLRASFHQSATYVDKILKGAKPTRKLPPSVDTLIVDFPGPRRCPCESRGSRRARSSRS